VSADRGQLEQVLLNLAVNARDAMPAGGTLTISTSPADFYEQCSQREPDTGPGRYAEITVRDTGIGMSRELSARIFERFFTTKPAGTGTGLGLSTVQGTIDDAGGTIEVESAEGHGTSFRICLPAIGPAAADRRSAAGAGS
jgi:signal transduction histidine kinase